jgi:aspartyl-tRNA(Asn)/glutamyl-tRNA(Gln) amidotransferase subunit C
MKREDIQALADLARIELSDEEIERFSREFDDILEYVGEIKGLAGKADAPAVGTHFNIFREDRDPTPADTYTEALLEAAPERFGRYLKVKKVLKNDNG